MSIIKLLLIVFVTFFLSACGGGDGSIIVTNSNGAGAAPIVSGKVAKVYLAPSSFIVTKAGEKKTIQIVAVDGNNIGVNTSFTIEQLSNQDNVDYGTFDTTSLTTDASGCASLIYTAPSDITALHERNITITESSENIQKTLQIKFSNTIQDSNATDYEINAVVDNSTGLNSHGSFVIHIQKVGNPNISILPADVKDVNVSTQFTQQLTIEDKNYNNAAIQTIKYTTGTISGTVIVDISAKVFNGKKDVLITKSVPLTILSGPVSALSLHYVSTQYDTNLGLFKDKFTIHAVDKYANPVNTKAQLFPTLINGFKIVSNNGSIYNNQNRVNFEDRTVNFNNSVNLNDNDRLIVLPTANKFKKSYLGGWTISSIDSDTKLTLVEDYNGSTESSLRYVVGNENRFVRDRVALADIQSTTGSYVTDENGNVQFDVTYDPILVGHTYSLSAVAYDKNSSRSGVSLRSSFKGNGLSYTADDVANDGNSHTSIISVSIKPLNDPLVGLHIVPSSVSVAPANQCDINSSASNFLTDNNGEFRVSVVTKGTDSNVKSCTVSWVASNSSIYFEY